MSLFQPHDSKLLHTREWSDTDRRDFLQAVDDSNDVEVTDWEASFIENTLAYSSEKEDFSFSPKQRMVIENLHIKYYTLTRK